MKVPKFHVLADADALARAAADLVVSAAGSAIESDDVFRLALSGGNTPRRLYEMLASDEYRDRINWAKTHVYFCDERCVPPDSPDSNFGLALAVLLDPVEAPYHNIHRMRGEIDPQAAADEYEAILRRDFPAGGMDLVLLGMGEDGHTASLFPGSAGLEESDRYAIANHIESLSAWRLTMTMPFINLSRSTMVLVAGAAKAARVQEVLEAAEEEINLPIQRLSPAGDVHWFMDVAAAGM